MLEFEISGILREHLDQSDIDGGHLEFLEYFGRVDEINCFENEHHLAEVVCEFLGIDHKSDFEKDGVNVEWDYFILTKERAIDLVKKISQVSLKFLARRGYIIDELNKIIKDFDFEEEVLVITVGEA